MRDTFVYTVDSLVFPSDDLSLMVSFDNEEVFNLLNPGTFKPPVISIEKYDRPVGK